MTDPFMIVIFAWMALPFVLSFLWLLNRKKAKSAVQDAATKDIEICELSEKVGQLVEKLEPILSIEEEAEQLRKAAEKT
jgi:hypothetical protein